MTNQDDTSGQLEIEQLAALYARARYGAFATLVLTGIVVMLLWGRVDAGVLATQCRFAVRNRVGSDIRGSRFRSSSLPLPTA